jgi:hypothetical protein
VASSAANPQLDTSLGLKGFQRARLLRAVLALGTFTRKELAAAARLDVDAASQIVARHKGWFVKNGLRRSGRQGPPEEVLSLHPDKQEALLRELEPLYTDLAAESTLSKVTPATYIPTSIEFRLVSDMVASVSPGETLAPAQFRRAERLLEMASEKEGLPVAENLEGYLAETLETAPAIERVAKANMDILRAKLCLASVPQIISGETEDGLRFHRPIRLGFGFLESAGRCLLDVGAVDKLRALDAWTQRHVSPVLAKLQSDPELVRSGIAAKILEPLRSPELRKILPDFVEKCAPRRVEILEEPEFPYRGGRIAYTIVDVNPFSSVPEICTATRVFRRYRSIGAITVRANAATIIDGLVSLYCTNYRPSADKVSALLNIRRNEMHIAVLNGKSLAFSRRIAMPAVAETVTKKGTHMYLLLTKRRDRGSVQILAELRKTLNFVRATDGHAVSDIYITGEPVLVREVKQAISEDLNIVAHDFSLSPHLHLNLSGFTPEQCAVRVARLAPEIGIAIKDWTTRSSEVLCDEVS